MSPTDHTPKSRRWLIAGAFLFTVVGVGGSARVLIVAVRYLRDHHAGPGAVTLATFIYGAVVMGIAWAFMGVYRRTSGRMRSTAAKNYSRRFMTAMSVYVFTLLTTVGVWRYLKPTGVLAYALATAPALPLIAAIGVIGVYLREEPDEFQRAILAEGALWATGGMMGIASVWGFLEMFRLVPHVDSWFAFPIWAVLLAPGQMLARRRYR